MHIKNFNQFKDLCPAPMMGLFIKQANAGDPDWFSDIISEVNYRSEFDKNKGTILGNDHPAWIEFNQWLEDNAPVTIDYDRVTDEFYKELGIR